MPILKSSFLSFSSSAVDSDTFGVHSFTGRSAISEPYHYEILLHSDKDDLDCQKILLGTATFKIIPGGLFPEPDKLQERDIHGILASFEQLHKVDDKTFYRAVLVPKLWLLSRDEQNTVFLNKSIPEIIEETLKPFGIHAGENLEMKLTSWKGGSGGDPVDGNGFPKWEYLCQYRESSLQFIQRLMERDGLYYFFEQSDQGEKLVICNAGMQQKNISPESIRYAPASSLDDGPSVGLFNLQQQRLPKQAGLVDYNYLKPTMFVSGLSEIDQNGVGEQLLYAEHFKTAEEGAALAKIRAEEFACQRVVYHGETTYTHLAAGYRCKIENHYRSGDLFNQEYQVLRMHEEGMQPSAVASGMSVEEAEQVKYQCRFECIPSSVQFRAARRTPRPRISGTIHAMIDLEGIDDKGRYKVRLPFEKAGGEGKASTWVRLAKPYTGNSYGFHFPLHKGTEVMVAFTDGDPDRPYIAAAMENENTPTQTKDVNVGRHQFATGSYTTFSTKSISGLSVAIPAITGGLLSQLGGSSGGDGGGAQPASGGKHPSLDESAEFTKGFSNFQTSISPTEIVYATQERLYVHDKPHVIHSKKRRIIQNEEGQTTQHTGDVNEYTKADTHQVHHGKITHEHQGDHEHTHTGKHTHKHTGDHDQTHKGKHTHHHEGDKELKRIGNEVKNLKGKLTQVIEGEAEYTTKEEVNEIIEANAKKVIHGNELKRVLGSVTDFTLGAENKICVGHKMTIDVGGATDVCVGMENKVVVAMTNSMELANSLKLSSMETKIAGNHVGLEAIKTKISTTVTNIKSVATEIGEIATNLRTTGSIFSEDELKALVSDITL